MFIKRYPSKYIERDEVIFCEDCGAIVLKRKAQEVRQVFSDGSLMIPLYFCSIHKKDCHYALNNGKDIRYIKK